MVHARKRQKITEGPTKSGYLNDIWKIFFFGKETDPPPSWIPTLRKKCKDGIPPLRAFHRRDTEKRTSSTTD
jgi:hypothetical protein